MAHSDAKSVDEYIDELDDNRKNIISTLRKLIVNALPDGYVETMNWGMICYEVPLSTFPKTYNKQPLMFAALAAQKNYNSLYLMSLYSDEALLFKLKVAFEVAGLKLNMGKSCIRFKKLEDLPLDAIKSIISAVSVEQFVAFYEKARK